MNTEEQILQLQSQVRELTDKLNKFIYPDRYQFDRIIQHKGAKLGIFSKQPITQWASGTGRQDVTSNTGSAMNVGAMFNGNVGTIYYSVGDIVAALKAYGILKE